MGRRLCGLVLLGAALIFGWPSNAGAAGLDAGVVNGGFNFSPSLGPLEQPSVRMSFAGGCPVLAVPTYVDAPGDGGGPVLGACGSVTMDGTLLNLSCGVGVGSGNFTVQEPTGEVMSGSFNTVMAGAIAVFALFPLSDDGGAGAAVGLFEITWPVLSSPPPTGTCATGVANALSTGVISGLHT